VLPAEPPKFQSWAGLLAPIKSGEVGWRVFALQSALGSVGRDTTPDGVFGPKTLRQVKGMQTNNGLVADGIAGPATQQKLIEKISHKTHTAFTSIPEGLMRGYAEAEGGNVLAATNWYTPVGGKAGVDCGPVQWRQYGPPFDEWGLRKAFDCETSFSFAAQLLIDRMREYGQRRPSLSPGMRLKLALLAHNAPFLADQYVRFGKFSTPDALAMWTQKPGGGHYTHAEWFEVYTSRLLKYVT